MKQSQKNKGVEARKARVISDNRFDSIDQSKEYQMIKTKILSSMVKELDEKNSLVKKQMPIETQEVKKSVNGHAEMEYYWNNLQVYADLGSRLEATVNRLIKLPNSPVSAQDKEEPVSCFADVLANNNNIFASYNNRLDRLLTTLETFI